MKVKGVIYILTNPSFPQYVKIGYAHDLERRMKQLNRSEALPYAFRAYAIYEVDSELTDTKLHDLIDNINPNLRTIETFDGKKRVKEFYEMSAEDAYLLMERIATISGTMERLKKVKPEGHEIIDEQKAQEAAESAKRGPFRFSMCGIKPGEEVVFVNDTNKRVTVVDDRRVRFGKTVTSLSALAQEWLGKSALQGPAFFTYKGKKLTVLREEMSSDFHRA